MSIDINTLAALNAAVDKYRRRALLVGLAALALAALILLGPPIAFGLLVFPALDITGWAAFWLTIGAVVVWWLLIRLYEVTRALLNHADLALTLTRAVKA
ncbi:hypothetical protein SEA_ZETA1847_34 [Microbacterium phage Zeta1847]|uniref:Uncharacterized protein n=1 Tax=Microbacterium phage Zeta1847 TaxID=2201444 RepID=A0A2Z4QAW4_9CAUD|nr:hypothetical protein HOT46_gp34 [Microbacterium phage Zeta1847]AWY06668.1 hypothetical protein SEA_ZETA1847_34 [Microbacterium phage Zeta1847]